MRPPTCHCLCLSFHPQRSNERCPERHALLREIGDLFAVFKYRRYELFSADDSYINQRCRLSNRPGLLIVSLNCRLFKRTRFVDREPYVQHIEKDIMLCRCANQGTYIENYRRFVTVAAA
jgi:hypothetical protein